ncbi:MAG TPA: DUF6569 family protein [Thermoleophilia bacterium]|nr:DUF6569 family protein [Thermoleophilia bacterium]
MTSRHEATNGTAITGILQLGGVQTARGLAVYPLTADTKGGPWYVTLGEALAGKQARVREVSEGGAVPELRFENGSDSRVLVLDGEELRGAKQNRVLNTTILVGKHSELIVPVSCTEQGRWHYDMPEFAESELVADRNVRFALKESVAMSARVGRGYRSDQGRVWDEVAMLHDRHGTHSRTGAQRDAYVHKKRDLDEVLAAFPLVDGQQGLLVLHGERVIGLDFVSIPEKYALLHDRLLRSYVFEALVSDAEVCDDAAVARAFLERIADLKPQSFKSPGLGWDLRFEGNGVLGSLLTYRGRPVHAAFFNVGGVQAGEGRSGGRAGEGSGGRPRTSRTDPRPERPEPQWRIADARERARRRQRDR